MVEQKHHFLPNSGYHFAENFLLAGQIFLYCRRRVVIVVGLIVIQVEDMGKIALWEAIEWPPTKGLIVGVIGNLIVIMRVGMVGTLANYPIITFSG